MGSKISNKTLTKWLFEWSVLPKNWKEKITHILYNIISNNHLIPSTIIPILVSLCLIWSKSNWCICWDIESIIFLAEYGLCIVNSLASSYILNILLLCTLYIHTTCWMKILSHLLSRLLPMPMIMITHINIG